MAIPGKVNFLQMGRYGEFSEQTYRNKSRERGFRLVCLLTSISSERFSMESFCPSPSILVFFPKSGKKTPWMRRFWSRLLRDEARSEIFGSQCHDGKPRLYDAECSTNSDAKPLGDGLQPCRMVLSEPDYPKGKLQKISRLVVADAFFSKSSSTLSAQGRLPRDKQVPQRCGSVLSDPSEANRKERSSEVV